MTDTEETTTEEKTEETVTAKSEETQTEEKSIGDAIGLSEEPDEGKPSDGTTEDKSEDKPAEGEGAPEQYADFELGEEVYITEERSGEMHKLMREQNLTQEQAKNLMSQFGGWQDDFLKHQGELVTDMKKSWLKDAKKDPEIVGPDGDKWEESRQLANRAVKEFLKDYEGREGVMEALNDAGVIDHPILLKWFIGVGRALLPDSVDPQGDHAVGIGRDKPAHEQMGWDYEM